MPISGGNRSGGVAPGATILRGPLECTKLLFAREAPAIPLATRPMFYNFTTSNACARRLARSGLVGMLALGCLLSSGCVRRRMTVVSNPPGGLVYIDNQEIGVTPVSTPFTYYGTREVQVVRDGYETVKQLNRVERPWYQYPPVDFFVENLWPWEIRDERIIEMELTPQRIVPTQELLDRAGTLRGSSQQGVVIPQLAPAALPVTQTQQYSPTAPVQSSPQTLPGPIGY